MFADLLRVRLRGIAELSSAQVELLQSHYELLVRWNRRLNLTRIESVEAAVERHYCESLFLAAHLAGSAQRIVDVGSGAGFPGFPVAVLRPDCEITLVEAHQRKAVFLREASRDLPNVRVLAVRAEDVAGVYDRVISRAVSYEDLSGVLKRLARAADLLTGAEEPPESMGFAWREAILLPWGRQRFLRQGGVVTG